MISVVLSFGGNKLFLQKNSIANVTNLRETSAILLEGLLFN